MPELKTTIKVTQGLSDTLGELRDEWDGVETKAGAIERLLADADLPTTDTHARIDELAEQVEENERHLELLKQAIAD